MIKLIERAALISKIPTNWQGCACIVATQDGHFIDGKLIYCVDLLALQHDDQKPIILTSGS